MKRLFLIVLDSVGAGALPDAGRYGDTGANTLKTVSSSACFRADNLLKLGLGCIDGLSFLPKTDAPLAATARLAELSAGKDTTTGHWEIAGLVSKTPFPIYPNGFPREIIDELARLTGRKILCNKPYSGTQVIADYGDEQVESGGLIVYTSADSVLQIAAHEETVPVDTLYEYCRSARKLMQGEHAVGRIIARPFTGRSGHYTRTAMRKDFSLEPHGTTLLDCLSDNGYDVISVGKISDIFAGRGITQALNVHGNQECTDAAMQMLKTDFCGLCFVNLVDFDMLYGHRNDIDGYARAVAEFDRRLGDFLQGMKSGDVLMITADHGCDPGHAGTDHTREYVPLLIYGDGILPVKLGTRKSFADIAATAAELFGVPYDTQGESFAKLITSRRIIKDE